MDINLTQIITAFISLVLAPVIILLVKVAIDWLKSKTKNEGLKAALDEAQIVADNVVSGLSASIVDELKIEGKLTKEAAGEILDEAVTLFYDDISTRSVELLESNAENIRAWIKRLIEQRLAVSKK